MGTQREQMVSSEATRQGLALERRSSNLGVNPMLARTASSNLFNDSSKPNSQITLSRAGSKVQMGLSLSRAGSRTEGLELGGNLILSQCRDLSRAASRNELGSKLPLSRAGSRSELGVPLSRSGSRNEVRRGGLSRAGSRSELRAALPVTRSSSRTELLISRANSRDLLGQFITCSELLDCNDANHNTLTWGSRDSSGIPQNVFGVFSEANWGAPEIDCSVNWTGDDSILTQCRTVSAGWNSPTHFQSRSLWSKMNGRVSAS